MKNPWIKQRLNIRYLTLILLWGLNSMVLAQEANQLQETGQTRVIAIGSGSFGPYYDATTNSGIFPEIIKAVFREMPGYEPKFLFYNNIKDVWRSYQAERFDAISNLFDSFHASGCRTEPAFRFTDVVISKAEDNRNINTIKDLQSLNIIAFEGAKEFFGAEFESYVSQGNYLEVGKQKLQPKLLLSGRYDVNVGDLYIFFHALSRLDKNVDPDQFKIHPIFPQISSSMGFRDESLCPIFNKALRKVKASGEYERIYRNYLERLQIPQ